MITYFFSKNPIQNRDFFKILASQDGSYLRKLRKHMKQTNWLLTLAFLLIVSSTMAQANAYVMATVKNHNPLVKKAELHVNAKYINNNVDIYESNILEDGSFAFAVEIYEPQYATIVYSRNKALVYLEPNDSLYITSDAGSFQFSIQFSGKGGHNNTYLSDYLKAHPKELNQFKMLQYKHGNYWFKCDQTQSEKMQRTPSTFFKKELDLQRQAAIDGLAFYMANNPDHLSSSFEEFIKAEINYDWAYNLLLYGTIFKNKHSIPESFMNFMDEISVQNSQVGNYRYREFVLAFLSYAANKDKDSGIEPYVLQYDLASNYLSGRALTYAQSEIIYRGFYGKIVDPLIPNYYKYLETSENGEFDEKVLVAYQNAMKQAAGTPAPQFKLKDNFDRWVSLDSYNGQVVFLNFWASWCRPCLGKMQMMQPMQEELKKLGVVFINVSLDRDKESWMKAISEWEFKGVHLLADGHIDSDIALAYEVKLLPEYFIINKNGNFSEKPKKFTAAEIKEVLNDLRR